MGRHQVVHVHPVHQGPRVPKAEAEETPLHVDLREKVPMLSNELHENVLHFEDEVVQRAKSGLLCRGAFCCNTYGVYKVLQSHFVIFACM